MGVTNNHPPRGKQPVARVVFHAAADAPPVSIWAGTAEPEGDALTLTLLYDYADFAPVAGWTVDVGAKVYSITAVDKRQVRCALVVTGGGV